jgi:hypothetical protein
LSAENSYDLSPDVVIDAKFENFLNRGFLQDSGRELLTNKVLIPLTAQRTP